MLTCIKDFEVNVKNAKIRKYPYYEVVTGNTKKMTLIFHSGHKVMVMKLNINKKLSIFHSSYFASL